MYYYTINPIPNTILVLILTKKMERAPLLRTKQSNEALSEEFSYENVY